MRAATGSARKIAVLGEMLELGAHATGCTRSAARAAAAAGLDLLDRRRRRAGARAGRRGASRPGCPRPRSSTSATSAEAADLALQRMRPGDLVLVKGSRGIGTDVVVDRLKAEFA